MKNNANRSQERLRGYEEDLQELEQNRAHLENEIRRMQSELKLLADEKLSLLHVYAVTKNHYHLPLTDEERIHLTLQIKDVSKPPADLCKGKKMLEAAEEYLSWRNEPATHGEMKKGMLAGGFEGHYKSFDNSLRSAMGRSGKFTRYETADGKLVWAMPEWINRAPERTAGSPEPNLTLVKTEQADAKTA